MKNDQYYFEIGYILEKLYESEINASLWWNWDGGYEVRIGGGTYNDEKNWDKSNNFEDLGKATEWLKNKHLNCTLIIHLREKSGKEMKKILAKSGEVAIVLVVTVVCFAAMFSLVVWMTGGRE